MNWNEKTYNSLIEKGKLRGLDKNCLDYYTEKHHIVPKCLGGTDEESNLVLLTAREHIIAHMLLSCINPGNLKLLFAVTKMFFIGKTKRLDGITKISTRLLSYFKEESSKAQLGKRLSSSHITHLSQSHTGNILSTETKLKLEKTRYRLTIMGPDGAIYNSIKECSKINNIPETTLKNWIHNLPQKGYSIVDKTRSRRSFAIVGPDGKEYKSIRDCARQLGYNDKTIKNWITKHPELGFKLK